MVLGFRRLLVQHNTNAPQIRESIPMNPTPSGRPSAPSQANHINAEVLSRAGIEPPSYDELEQSQAINPQRQSSPARVLNAKGNAPVPAHDADLDDDDFSVSGILTPTTEMEIGPIPRSAGVYRGMDKQRDKATVPRNSQQDVPRRYDYTHSQGTFRAHEEDQQWQQDATSRNVVYPPEAFNKPQRWDTHSSLPRSERLHGDDHGCRHSCRERRQAGRDAWRAERGMYREEKRRLREEKRDRKQECRMTRRCCH